MHKINAIGIATLALTALAGSAAAQVSLGNSTYTQNFDALPSSGSATFVQNSTIPGWYAFRTGTGTTVVADTGSSNGGNLYSYGSAGSSDRALGSLGSSNAAAGDFSYAVVLTRAAGLRPVTGLSISFTGEQWRNGASTAQTFFFGSQTFTTQPTTTADLGPNNVGYTGLSALDFIGPISGGTAGALNGNLVANRATRTGSLTGLNLTSSNFLALRWRDIDNSGADHGLSIDDVGISVTSQANALPTATDFSATINLGDQPYTLDLFSLLSDTDITAAWGESFSYVGTGDTGFSRTGNSLTLSGVGNGTYIYLFTATDSLGASTALTTVSITVVPTPGAAALLGTGALLMARRRRA